MTRRLNPHGILTALDPPRDSPPRRWRCDYCHVTGLLDEVRKIACSHVYPPCPHCGQTPECAPDCSGIMSLLASPRVRVVGELPPKKRTSRPPN